MTFMLLRTIQLILTLISLIALIFCSNIFLRKILERISLNQCYQCQKKVNELCELYNRK